MKDKTKEIQLKKHKRIATSLFFLMALIYGLMVYLQLDSPRAWMGYIESFSEAGMVGALADWFAVTALFRHPLGLKIPHTNLIERKKNDLGENLGKFVNDNFINPENIRPYIERLNIVKIVSNWLSRPNNQKVLEEEILNLLNKIIRELEDDEVENFLSEKGIELLKSIDYPKITSSGLHYLIDRNEHINLLENLLPQIKEYVYESQDLIKEKISENRPFIAFLAGKKISRELTEGLISFIEEVELDKNHFVRKKLTQNLDRFADDLLTSPSWQNKFDQLKEELIIPENLEKYTHAVWQAIKQTLVQNLEDSDSLLKNYIHKNVQKLAHNLETDEEMNQRINRWIQHFAYRMILKNRTQVEQLISKTVESWEGKELSDKLELEVGKDLQFIRINGTLVGGLVGLIIHTLTVLFIS